MISEELNRAMVIGSGLPDAGAGQPLPAVDGRDRRQSAPVAEQPVRRRSRQRTFFSGDVDDKVALAVSIEPAGTVPTAPTPPIQAILSV